MSRTRQLLCVAYALVAVAALWATWGQNLAYFGAGASGAGTQFVLDTKVNPASRSITVDIGLFLLAAVFFMVSEARKLRVRWVWAYVIFGFVIAISVTFPLFMIARELRLGNAEKAGEAVAPGVSLTVSDVVGLVVVTAVTLGLVGFILT